MLNIVLYEPEIAGNTGNVGRTCVALGAKLWLVRPLGFQIEDRHLRRAGMDYWAYLDWEAVDNWEELLRRLGDCRPWFFTKTANRSYLDAEFSQTDVLVFGSESRGLPPSILENHANCCLRIPIHENARSLNLSVAVAVAAYEARRQCIKAVHKNENLRPA
jgi:tRNA (cytidine/uridine-2'-O-)-methyltransferase